MICQSVRDFLEIQISFNIKYNLKIHNFKHFIAYFGFDYFLLLFKHEFYFKYKYNFQITYQSLEDSNRMKDRSIR